MNARPGAFLRAVALVVSMLLGRTAAAALAPDQLVAVGVRPPPQAALPLGARLSDLNGRSVTLSSAIAGKPSIVVFADYNCPELCSSILALTGAALAQSGLAPGVDYRLVVIGFNPKASAADARRMVEDQIGFSTAVGRSTTALMASAPVAAQLTSAVGYRYVYDAERGRYAHPAALLVVGSDGRLSRVLSGLAISGADARLALVEAGKGTIGALADQVRLVCYGFGASVGYYTDRIRLLLAVAAAATLLALGGALLALSRLEARGRA